MTPEEELVLSNNIAKLKGKISFQKKGAKHSFIISLLLTLAGFVGLCIGFIILPYILYTIAGIGMYVSYKFLYWSDFNTHVLMSIEKSDLKFFMDNPQ